MFNGKKTAFEIMNDPTTCKHLNFKAKCDVTRLVDKDDVEQITGFTADLKIECSECGKPFMFIGVPSGYSPSQPMVSADLCELRIPIKPSAEEPVKRINEKLN